MGRLKPFFAEEGELEMRSRGPGTGEGPFNPSTEEVEAGRSLRLSQPALHSETCLKAGK